MKRDLELVRKILCYFEDREEISVMTDKDIAEKLVFDGYSHRQVGYHLRIMAQAGLLTCEIIKSSSSDRIVKVWPFELSWEGQEFLSMSREESIWNQVRKRAGSGLASMSFEVLKMLLAEEAKKRLGLK